MRNYFITYKCYAIKLKTQTSFLHLCRYNGHYVMVHISCRRVSWEKRRSFKDDVGEFIDAVDHRWDKRLKSDRDIRQIIARHKSGMSTWVFAGLPNVEHASFSRYRSALSTSRLQLQRSNISGLVFLFLERVDSSLGSYGRCYALASKHEQSTGVVPDLTCFYVACESSARVQTIKHLFKSKPIGSFVRRDRDLRDKDSVNKIQW